MQIKKTENTDERELVGFISKEGGLFLRFNDHQAPTQRTAVLGSRIHGDKSTVSLNGTGTIDQIISTDATPIYEGDEITIKF
jgi:hypothetical protein